MSGPKVDVTSLREQEQKRLEQARQRRMDTADKVIRQLKELKKLDALEDPTGTLSGIRQEQEKRLGELLEQLRNGNEYLDCDSITKEVEVLAQEWVRSVRPLLAQNSALQESDQQRKQLVRESNQLTNARRGAIRVLAEASTPGVVPEVTQKEVFGQVQEFVREIKEFLTQPGIPIAKKNSILGLHTELMELSRSDMATVKKSRRIARLYEDFQQISALAQREMEQMRLVYDRYVRECFDVPGGVKALEEFRSQQEIETAIVEGKAAASGRMSREYIKRQISEVMAKHGYNVVRSDVLQQSGNDSQVLYGVNDRTAINVFVSDDDQVTMRVVGIGFDETITPEENEQLFQQQCAFCALHPQITEELKMRGVLLQTKKHLPPDRKYNKKIQTKTKSSSQGTSKAKKELKRTELKVMRKE